MVANGHTKQEYVSPPTKLRRMIYTEGECVWAPGIFDGLSARLAMKNGCEALYMSGANVTASRLGLPALAFASQDDFVSTIATIHQIDPTIPIIADADTGFGGLNQIARTVRRYIQAGASCLHLEDQISEKRCGHLAGKILVSREEYWLRTRAAVKARDEYPGGTDFMIMARSDAKQGYGLEEAILRLKGAINEGADIVFVEGVDDFEDYIRCVKEFAPTPVKASILQGGHAPKVTYQQLKDMGIRLVTLPALGIDASLLALDRAYGHARRTGTDIGSVSENLHPRMVFKACGYEGYVGFEKDVGGSHFDKGT